MKKVWLPPNAYATLQKIAQRQGVTPDEALVNIILKNVRR